MASPASLPHDEPDRIALLVAHSRGEKMLCPFYAKCDGLLVINRRTLTHDYQANTERTNLSISNLILASGATHVICGFIAPSEKGRLLSFGIDVRIGSCLQSPENLVAGFNDLPRA